MEGGTVRYKYTGTALPLANTTYTLFSTVTAFPYANAISVHNIHRIYLTLQNDHTGTLKVYKSQDRGVNWTQCQADISVAASTTNTDTPYDFLVEGYMDFKIDFANGASNQTTFIVDMSSTGSRNVGA